LDTRFGGYKTFYRTAPKHTATRVDSENIERRSHSFSPTFLLPILRGGTTLAKTCLLVLLNRIGNMRSNAVHVPLGSTQLVEGSIRDQRTSVCQRGEWPTIAIQVFHRNTPCATLSVRG
jgi:hypothetical protein